MLNIGKMDGGAASGMYYLQSVAQGREDYYLHSGEAPGRWYGDGCATFDLDGRVEAEPFLALLSHVNPTTGEDLGKRWARESVAGLDLTFRAPKSVSILFALGGAYGHEDLTAAMRDAHDRAVQEALDYMGSVAGHGRRGKGGSERVEGVGLIHALFRHRTSRAGDPQLHTHAVTPNRVLGKDGKWGSLDSKAFYGQAKTCGTIYQAALRYHLRDLGFQWELGENGTAEIVGMSRKLRREFSKRRQEIEKALAARGLDPSQAGAAQKATLHTRQKKDYGVDAALLEFGWADRAAKQGFTVAAMDELLARGMEWLHEQPDTADDREQAAAQLAGEMLLTDKGLTERASTFVERDVIRMIAAQLPEGAPAERIVAYAKALLGHEQVVELEAADGRLGRADVIQAWRSGKPGQVIPVMGGSEVRYSTIELQDRERELVDMAVAGQGGTYGRCSPAAVNVAVDDLAERGKRLNAEQDMMVRSICLSGDFLTVVNAAAGCGKTTAMGAAARALEGCGYKVVGVSLAAKAASILQDETGVPCFTVAQLMWELGSDRWDGFAQGSVVIVDEASMVGTRSMHRIARELRAAGGKMILVGDVHQLPEVDAGGAFKGLMADGRLRPVELVRNMRQLDPDEQARLLELRRGSVADALRSYDEAGHVSKTDTSEDARNLLAVDWSVAWIAAGNNPKDRAGFAMIALTNADVADLNRRARVLLKEAGVLTGPELLVGDDDRGFMVGDHVVTREISRRSQFHVLNGERWIVTGIDPDVQTATLNLIGGDRQVTVPAWYLEDGSLHHAYALTVNISQGTTLRGVYGLGSEAAYRQAVYTLASRPWERVQFYLCRDPEWVDDALIEQTHAPAVDRRQLPLDLGDLGVLAPAEVDPLGEFITATSRVRGDTLSIDTASPVDAPYIDAGNLTTVKHPGDREGHTAQQGDLDLWERP